MFCRSIKASIGVSLFILSEIRCDVIAKRFGLLTLFFLLPLFATMAKDEYQPPIIAQRENKLYAVSSFDGSATLLVEAASDERLAPLTEDNISLDNQWLAYVIYKQSADLSNAYRSNLFLLNLMTREVLVITPSGGAFDRPLAATRVFYLSLPTWSYDGSRLYFVRDEFESRGKRGSVASELVYYDLERQVYHLVRRLNPVEIINKLMPIKSGILVQRLDPDREDIGNVTLYAADNSIISNRRFEYAYPKPLLFHDRFYYLLSPEWFAAKVLVDIDTGKELALDGVYYMAERSQAAGENSLRMYQFMKAEQLRFNVYRADHSTSVQIILEKNGVKYGIAPDGQSIAFLQFLTLGMGSGVGSIQVMDNEGKIRKLPFEAEEIV